MQKETIILAIESSCDETSAAVVKNGRTILGHIIASQTDLHSQFGGVFPEVASRKHIEVVYPVVQQCMKQAGVTFDQLDAVAVTTGPGLVGSLLVGVNMAKGIATAANLPLIEVNHIEGHIYSIWLTEQADAIEFPIVNLIVSGGHSELVLMEDHQTYHFLGGTLDDAAGEAYDKVGRLLKLPYPGGPHIDRMARDGDSEAFAFPRAVMKDGYNFSFSGLKTAAIRELQKDEMADVADISASFQAAVVDVLVTKTSWAVNETDAKAVHIVGGVSANRGLREGMEKAVSVPVRYPPMILCTDNAAMIGAAAHQHLISGKTSPNSFDVDPSWQLAK